MSGVLAFFRSLRPGAVHLWQRVLPALPLREQTARACPKPVLRLWHQGAVLAEKRRVVLGGLAMYLSPPAVLCTRMAAQLVCASELRVRERGRPRPPWMTRTLCEGARAGVPSTARAQGSKPRSFFACSDAGCAGFAKDDLQGAPRRVQ